MSQLDLVSYLLGAASAIAALAFYVVVRRSRRAATRRKQARERRAEATARRQRHDVYKARVRFVPSDQVTGEQDAVARRRGSGDPASSRPAYSKALSCRP